jgi:6-methylsalicylate decarboxylase
MTMAQHEPGPGSGGQVASGRIDVHAHYVPAELQASLPSAPIFRGFAAWEPQAALEMMDRQGIATAILSMVLWTAMFAAEDDAAAARRVARSSNEAAAEAIRTHPGRFGGFARLPLPGVDEADVQNLIQVLGGNPLLQPDERARIERHNAMELFPRLRPGAVVH